MLRPDDKGADASTVSQSSPRHMTSDRPLQHEAASACPHFLHGLRSLHWAQYCGIATFNGESKKEKKTEVLDYTYVECYLSYKTITIPLEAIEILTRNLRHH